MRYSTITLAIWLATWGPATAQDPARQTGRTQHETRTLSIGSKGLLNLETLGGTITVTSGPGLDATLEIIKVSHARTDAEAQQELNQVTVDATVRGDRASVRANYPDQRSPNVTVSYVVSTPPDTRVNVHSVGGDLNITGIRGEVAADTVGGSINVADTWQVVSLTTVGGDISITGVFNEGALKAETVGGSIRVAQTKAHRLTATAVGGNITAREVTCDSADVGTTSGNVEFSGPLARDGRYDLHAQSGNVRVTPSGGAGFELRARTFSGDIHSDVPIETQEKSTLSPNRELRGVVGDGSAVLIARTFSGSVVIGK